MSYNYHNQQQNYPGTNTHPQPQGQYQGQYQSHNSQPQPQPQQQRQGFNDPFFNFGDTGFNMDIREDFEDPFEHIGNRMGGFGFPNVDQMLGQFQNEINNMRQLSDGMENQIQNNINNNNMNNNQIQTGGQGGQRGMFISMHGMGGGAPGTMISKTYMSKMDYSGGQPHEESYQSQSIKQFGEGGHNISERQEAYKNSRTGMQKAAHQRLLDDRGTKLIKQRNVNTGEQSQHNIYKGLQENELDSFNKQYNDYREKVHFQDNYKYLNELNPGKMFKQLGKGKGDQGQNNLMLGDGNNYPNYGNNNQYQPHQYQNQPQQGQNNNNQYGRPQQYPPQYNNPNNNYRKGY